MANAAVAPPMATTAPVSSDGEVGAAVKTLRARRFDLAIDLQGLLKSALPVFWSGARSGSDLDRARVGNG